MSSSFDTLKNYNIDTELIVDKKSLDNQSKFLFVFGLSIIVFNMAIVIDSNTLSKFLMLKSTFGFIWAFSIIFKNYDQGSQRNPESHWNHKNGHNDSKSQINSIDKGFFISTFIHVLLWILTGYLIPETSILWIVITSYLVLLIENEIDSPHNIKWFLDPLVNIIGFFIGKKFAKLIKNK